MLLAVARRAREAARGRPIVLVGENEPQQVHLMQPPARGGYGLDAPVDVRTIEARPVGARAPPRGLPPPPLDGAVLGPHVFVLRLFGQDDGDRLLLVNLGPDWPLEPAPEPLLAPPESARWTLRWSSEPRYGGSGIAHVDPDEGWVVAGESATVFGPEPRPASSKRRRSHSIHQQEEFLEVRTGHSACTPLGRGGAT